MFKAALAQEVRPAVRVRLEAILAYAKPQRPKVLHPSTRRWLRLLRAEGLQALLQRRRKRRKPRDLGNVPHIRAEIAAALNRKPDWRLQLRLKAIDAVLTGQLPEHAAAIAHVKTETLEVWLARIGKPRELPPSSPAGNAAGATSARM